MFSYYETMTHLIFSKSKHRQCYSLFSSYKTCKQQRLNNWKMNFNKKRRHNGTSLCKNTIFRDMLQHEQRYNHGIIHLKYLSARISTVIFNCHPWTAYYKIMTYSFLWHLQSLQSPWTPTKYLQYQDNCTKFTLSTFALHNCWWYSWQLIFSQNLSTLPSHLTINHPINIYTNCCHKMYFNISHVPYHFFNTLNKHVKAIGTTCTKFRHKATHLTTYKDIPLVSPIPSIAVDVSIFISDTEGEQLLFILHKCDESHLSNLRHCEYHLSLGFTTFTYKHIYTSSTILSTSNRNYFPYSLVWPTVLLWVPNSIPPLQVFKHLHHVPNTLHHHNTAWGMPQSTHFPSFQYNASSYRIPYTYSYKKYSFHDLLFTISDNIFIFVIFIQ
jgi:hypothetical protein